MKSLDEARAYQKQEISALTSDLWEAILEADKALKAGGLQGLPAAVISKANANLVRAGVLSGGASPTRSCPRWLLPTVCGPGSLTWGRCSPMSLSSVLTVKPTSP